MLGQQQHTTLKKKDYRHWKLKARNWASELMKRELSTWACPLRKRNRSLEDIVTDDFKLEETAKFKHLGSVNNIMQIKCGY